MRYALFAGLDYYPDGGWSDHVISAETMEKCRELVSALNYREGGWWHIVDLQLGAIVDSGTTPLNKKSDIPPLELTEYGKQQMQDVAERAKPSQQI